MACKTNITVRWCWFCVFIYATGICICAWFHLSPRLIISVPPPPGTSELDRIIRTATQHSAVYIACRTCSNALNSTDVNKTSTVQCPCFTITSHANQSIVQWRSTDANKSIRNGTFTTQGSTEGTKTGMALAGGSQTHTFSNPHLQTLPKSKASDVVTTRGEKYSQTVSDVDKPGIKSTASVTANSIIAFAKSVATSVVSPTSQFASKNTGVPRTETLSIGQFGNDSASVVRTSKDSTGTAVIHNISRNTATFSPSLLSSSGYTKGLIKPGTSSNGPTRKAPDLNRTTIGTTLAVNIDTVSATNAPAKVASASTAFSNRGAGAPVTETLSAGQAGHRSDIVRTQMNQSATGKVYLCMTFSGRLGNLMFQFAALVGTARHNNMTPAIPKDNSLRSIFNMNISEINSTLPSAFAHVGDKRHCAFDPITADFRSNLTMSGFFQSWRYFSNIFSELRKQFTFKEEIVKRARVALEASIQSQHPHLSLRNITFVGIHIRRGDILNPDKVKFGYAVGSKDYLFQAMGYFMNKYQSVIFIVCSNDMEWSRKNIPNQNATFILGQQAEVDMAILSLCNHTIMTVGSYGWWSAWLAGGTTIYQIQQVIPGTSLDKMFNLTDYMLPTWIGINKTSL